MSIVAVGPVLAQTAPPSTAFSVDAGWPRPLPDNLLIGQVSGISVDAQDRIWVVNRPGSHSEDERGAALTPPRSICCVPAPPILVFDTAGNLLSSWTGEARGERWPNTEHSIFVDHQGFVWVGGNGENDGFVVKYTQDGKFVLRIGSPGPSLGNADTTRLGRPAGLFVDPRTNELYIADGYDNRRIIVFDAATGAYRRHWGAYGEVPTNTATTPPAAGQESGPGPQRQFGQPHAVRVAQDGLVYVADRPNDRIQVFQTSGVFVSEHYFLPETRGLGSVWDLAFLPQDGQSRLVLADGENNQLRLVTRATGDVASSFGRRGRNAGEFHWVHSLGVDSRGAIYTGEVNNGKRLQKFVPTPATPGP